MEDFYELLGVSEDASTDEIDQAWRERVREYHPDVNDDARANAQFKALKTAHEVLSDEPERAAYDRLGHETYVQERLDGLPTGRHPSPGASAGRERRDRDGTTGERADGRAGGSDRAGSAAGSRSDAQGRTDSRSTGGTGRDRGTTRAAERGRSSARSAATSSSAGRRGRPRSPLAYGWAGVAVAGAVYALGLWSYLGANAAVLSALAERPPAAVASALGRTHDLVAPGTFVLDAAADGTVLPLALAAGAVGLAVGFVAVVASFGRGAAYLYTLGGLAPAAALAIGPVVAAPDGAVVLLAVVVPVAAVVLFLVDVGRELLAGP